MGQGRQYGALKEEKGGRSAPLHHLLCHHARQVKPPPFTHPFWPFRHTLSPSYLFTYYFDSVRSLSTLLPPPPRIPLPPDLSFRWLSLWQVGIDSRSTTLFFFSFCTNADNKMTTLFLSRYGRPVWNTTVRDKIPGIYGLIWLIYFTIKLDKIFGHECIIKKF